MQRSILALAVTEPAFIDATEELRYGGRQRPLQRLQILASIRARPCSRSWHLSSRSVLAWRQMPNRCQQKDGAFVFTNPYSYALHDIVPRSNFDTIVDQLNEAAAKLETEPEIGCVQRMLMKTSITSPLAAASIQRK
eukprot:gene29764-4974_t